MSDDDKDVPIGLAIALALVGVLFGIIANCRVDGTNERLTVLEEMHGLNVTTPPVHSAGHAEAAK